MEYQQKNQNGQQFFVLSMLLAILSFMTIQFVIFPFILGGLSILFAIIGRGSSEKIPDKGILSIVISIAAMVFTAVITAFAVKMIFTDANMRQQMNDYSMELYGETFDDMMKEGCGVELPPAEDQSLPK